MSEIATKPYLIRAIHQWCVDNNYTPYLAVAVIGDKVQVPLEYVKDDQIVLNVSHGATRNLDIGNDWISFSTRFGGISRDIVVPVGAVISIFARETGGGMSFEIEEQVESTEPPPPAAPTDDRPKGRAKLQVIK